MATPTITFNTSTGGPVSGTAASFSGSVVTLDGSPSLAGCPIDGSAVLWMLTSTGRQFFTINAIDDVAKTVTVDDAPASGDFTPKNWATRIAFPTNPGSA